MKREILVQALTFLLFACGGDSDSEELEKEGIELEESVVLEYEEEGNVTRIEERSPGKLIVACPLGVVCDQNFDYRAHSYDDNNATIYMSFLPGLVNSYSLESLVESFNYLNLVIKFPDRST